MGRLDILKALCKSRGITINKLEQELGISQGSLSKMENSVPKSDKLYAIAQYFGVPMEVFFASAEDIPLITAKKKLEDAIEEAKRTPIYEVACGEGRINGEYACEYAEEDNEEGYSWCRVIGDSMYPDLRDGDMVKVRHQTQTEPTDFTVVKVDGESATIKYLEIVENGIWLRAVNKEVYDDHYFSISEVMSLPITIVGKVVQLQRSL